MALARQFFAVALCTMVAAPSARLAAGERSDVIELRVMTFAADPEDVELAGQTALDVLGAAGLRALWRICRWSDPCTPSGDARWSVPIQLLPLSKRTDSSVSGEVAKDVETSGPAILVYVASDRALTQSFRQNAPGRSNPALASLTAGFLMGLTIAHEVGHVLGLQHSRTGLMKRRWDSADIIAARGGRLRFQPNETIAMGIAMRTNTVALRHANLEAASPSPRLYQQVREYRPPSGSRRLRAAARRDS